MLLAINLIFTVLLGGGIFYFWQQNRVAKDQDGPEQEEGERILIAISVPKNNDRTPLAAEQFFAALHGIFRSGVAVQSQISCEIVAKNKQIHFYLQVPGELKDFILSQVYAQYPTVDIKVLEPTEDYTNLSEEKAMAIAELSLKKPTVYPIKTFLNFEVDPLSAITGVLSSASTQEELWVQLIIRPIDDDWQDKGDAEIKAVKEGKKPMSVSEIIKKEGMAFTKDLFRSVTSGAPPPEKKEEKKDDKKELPGPIQQAVKGIEEKITKLGFEASLRLLAAAPDPHTAQAKLEQLVGAFKQYNSININSFISKGTVTERTALEDYQKRNIGTPEMIFNITELASLYHFPSETVTTPTISWAGSKKGEPPGNLPIVGTVPADELTVLGTTNFRNEMIKFGIKRKDRRLHSYIIGKTGTGKSTLLENMIYDDIQEGRGVAVVDPHGQLIEHVLKFIPEHRIKDVVYFNAADHDFPMGFNVLENKDLTPETKVILTSGVVGVFEKIFGEVSWGPRLEYILRNVILGLLDYPNATMLGIMRVLSDNAYRRLVVNEIKDPTVRAFFVEEYEKYEPKFRQEAIAPIQNKVGQFLSSSLVRNIVGQPVSTIRIGDIMNGGKILLADLSKGRIGEDNSTLLGSLLVTQIQLTSMARTNIPEDERRDFYLYVDEFQNFATSSFATILSEARKYRLNLIMAHQYVAQLPEAVRDAVFGNVGTTISFRINATDADALQKEFEPVFEVNDLVNLDNYTIYLKMAVDGVTVPAFSAATLPPPATEYNFGDQIVESSRQQFASSREDVEEYILDWSSPIDLSEMSNKGDRGEPPKMNTKLESDKIITKPQGESAAPKPVTDEPKKEGTEQQTESRGTLPSNLKTEILKDRFNRNWYAVTKLGEEKEEGTPSQASEREVPPVVGVAPAADPPVPSVITPAAAAVSGPVTNVVPPPVPAAPVQEERALAEPVSTEVMPITDSSSYPIIQSGGEGEPEKGEEQLITWEKASELGMESPPINTNSVDDKTEFLPIDEL